jgi:hypothetical protein
MRGAAAEDEDAEHQKHPLEWEIRALAHEVHQCQRDEVVRERDHGIRDRVKPDDLGIPEETDAVRHEVGRQKLLPEFGHDWLLGVANGFRAALSASRASTTRGRGERSGPDAGRCGHTRPFTHTVF